MSTPTVRFITQCRANMITAVRNYEDQKRHYEAIKAAYDRPDRDPITSRYKAAADPRSGEATGLANWYRDEAAMYAAVIAALRADEAAAGSPTVDHAAKGAR